MNRRRFLAAGAAATATGLAGCRSMFETRSARVPPLVEDRPDAVYVPTHVEGMQMIERVETDEYALALFYSFPHRFWLVTGQEADQVEIQGDDTVHLMGVLWDRETELIPPNGSLSFTVEQDGEQVADKTMWPMLSQNMGFHFGDNVALDGEGTYDVTVDVGPMDARRTGAFRDRFDEQTEATVEFEFDRATLEETRFERLEEQQGQVGAVEPMGMGMVPSSQVPEPEALPGEVVGETTGADARFVATRLDEPPAGVDGDGPYLAVSARTPYNRYPLPFMSVSATLARDGDAAFDGALAPTFDPDLHYHYGAAVDAVESGDELTLSVGAPPQVSRHEGYETAFFDFPEMTIEVE